MTSSSQTNTYCTAPRAGKTRGKHLAFYIHIGWLPQQPASLSWHQVNRWPNTHLLRPRFGKRGIKLKVLSMNVSERIARALEVDSVPPRENSQATAAHVTAAGSYSQRLAAFLAQFFTPLTQNCSSQGCLAHALVLNTHVQRCQHWAYRLQVERR